MTNTRRNCPRIMEIETQLSSLIAELWDLVQPTEEEQEGLVDQVADLSRNEIKDWLGEYELATDALDSRDREDESEANMHQDPA